MDTLVVNRADGRDDGEDWTESYEQLPGGEGVHIHASPRFVTEWLE